MFNWVCSPAATELEAVVMDWLAQAMRLPAKMRHGEDLGGGGLMMSSASESILTVMTAARDRALDRICDANSSAQRRRDAISDLIVLGSPGTHSSTEKAARILGIRYQLVDSGDSSTMTAEGLARALADCSREGRHACFLTVTMGTTSTCATDDLAGIENKIREESAHGSIWVHLDASYAGNALICPEYQHLSKPLETFDSFNVNLNKWLLVNVDAR